MKKDMSKMTDEEKLQERKKLIRAIRIRLAISMSLCGASILAIDIIDGVVLDASHMSAGSKTIIFFIGCFFTARGLKDIGAAYKKDSS